MGATDSKLAFRKGVFRLFEERNVPITADDYWDLFWTLPESVDDVYTLVGSTDIRRARDGAKENLETLIDKIMQQMHLQLHSTNPVQTSNLLNCCRVLTRIIPYIFESPECIDWENNFFWTSRLVEKPDDGQKKSEQYITLPPRAETLISLTLECLFLAGFTLPPTMTTEESRVNYVIWETGVGSSTPIGSSRDNDMNRTEVLRLLTVLLSRSMYITPSQILTKPDRWLEYMVSKTERKVVLAFLCSMINTSCKYNPMGWTAVPYNHIMYTDPREQLVAVCLRVLLIVLDYRSPGIIQSDNNTEIADHAETMDNAFRYYLSKLHRAQDFQFLIDGIYRILSNPMQTLNTYLPGSSKKVRYHVEMMMLCWKLLEMNGRFRSYLMETERALDLMIVLIFYASENKLDPSQVGVVRMCAFILQTLSSDRTFSVRLNKHFEGHASLPVNIRLPNFSGSYADYLILTIFSLIASSRGTLSTLYPALIKTITNISPYLKNLSTLTSSRLISLFNSMSAPGFLLADESNHYLIGYLLEALNNIIQFQFSNNPNLILAILRNQQKFESLADFSLDNAMIEIERLSLLKETSTNNRPSEEQQDAASITLSEKAKGKLPEGSLSRVSSTSSISQQQPNNMPSRQVSLSSIASTASLLPGVKNGFTPTDDWIYHWHSRLPLDTISAVIRELLPKIELDNANIEFLRGFAISDILPQAHAICIRKFQWGDALVIWFRSMLWGQTYISSVSNYGPWNNTRIKLFHIKQQVPEVQTSPRPSLTLSRVTNNNV
ncbi:high-temperature-induced dauer-formation protein [Helicostylum pulchrum]|nr:high-temperature-induced dauer-formation protein [Helicostylum pulchrum]